jgi:hypothetical protein
MVNWRQCYIGEFNLLFYKISLYGKIKSKKGKERKTKMLEDLKSIFELGQ